MTEEEELRLLTLEAVEENYRMALQVIEQIGRTTGKTDPAQAVREMWVEARLVLNFGGMEALTHDGRRGPKHDA
jgi:hypothetical protein